MSAEQLSKLLKQAEALSAEEKLVLAKHLVEQAHHLVAPPLAQDNLKQAGQLKWLKAHQAEYAGRYVALDGDRLLTAGSTYRDTLEAAQKMGALKPFIVHVPDPNTTYFAGW